MASSNVFRNLKRYDDPRRIIDDAEIDLIVTAAIPADRADIAVEAMRAGKDVMTDKPGCTSLDDLERIKKAVAETARIWSVNFSERFEVPAVAKAGELIRGGSDRPVSSRRSAWGRIG